jgi:HSP90 family molecular chaperone
MITVANQTTNYPTEKTYTFTSDGDGTFSVTSSDTSVATVTNNGKTITLTPKKV